MAKAKINESHTLSAEGFLNITGDKIMIEAEDVGEKNLADLLIKFNGELVKFSIKKNDDIVK